MIHSAIYHRLAENITQEVVNFNEYQEKYYLMKYIEAAIPSLQREEIYRLINAVNQEIASPTKKRIFIKKFISSMKS